MFGHQNDQSTQQDNNAIPEDSIQGALSDPAATDAQAQVSAPPLPPAAHADEQPWQHPGLPIDGPQAPQPAEGPQPISDVISPAGGFPKAPTFPAGPAPVMIDNPVAVNDEDPVTHELIDIKQHALSELSPLIDELDQAPEEKFRTLMMMIQASDDQHLVKAAYAAAHSIEDEKVRARALLDIVNEINYFTQQPEN